MFQNDNVFRYQVTVEEYVYDVIRKLARLDERLDAAKDHQNTDQVESVTQEQATLKSEFAKVAITERAKEKHKDVARIVGSKHTLKLLVCLSRFGTHFRHLPEMKANWIKNNMFQTIGGVSGAV